MTELIVLVFLMAAAAALAWRLRPHTLVAIDTSGSTQWGRPDAPATFGDIRRRFPRWTLRRYTWVTFDHTGVSPYTPGDKLTSFGGTSYHQLTSWVDAQHVNDNAGFTKVIVVTDGHAPEVNPVEPEKWTWLLTEDASPADWLTEMHHEPLAAA